MMKSQFDYPPGSVQGRVQALLDLVECECTATHTEELAGDAVNDESDYVAEDAIVLLSTCGEHGVKAIRTLLSTLQNEYRLYATLRLVTGKRLRGFATEAELLCLHGDVFVQLAAIDYMIGQVRDSSEYLEMLERIRSRLCAPALAPSKSVSQLGKYFTQVRRRANRWRRRRWGLQILGSPPWGGPDE